MIKLAFRKSYLYITVVAIIAGLIVIWGLSGGLSNSNPPKIESFLRVQDHLFCSGDATDSIFSKNPPYYVNQKYYYWFQMNVTSNATVSDVVLSDQLNEALMIEGVSFTAIDRPGPYQYTFDYGAYESGASVSVTNGTYTWNGFLNENGVEFGDFVVKWTGDSLKPNFEWNVGSMAANASRLVYVTTSTRTNADGLQEFASPGNYVMNTGAVVKGYLESEQRQTVGEGNSITINVFLKT